MTAWKHHGRSLLSADCVGTPRETELHLLRPKWKSQILTNYSSSIFLGGLFFHQVASFSGASGACMKPLFLTSGMGRVLGFFFQKGKQQLTCFHRTSSACLASPGCIFVETSVECCEHPSPAAWRGLPISFHQDAVKQGTSKIIFIFTINASALVSIEIPTPRQFTTCYWDFLYLLLRT